MKVNKYTPVGLAYIVVIIMTISIIMFTGCSMFTLDQKREAQELVMTYLETYGQDKVIEYIDKLVTEGRLGYKNAEEIKAMIPELLEKIRKAKDGDTTNE